MDLFAQLALIVTAIASGWLMGRLQRRTSRSKKNVTPENYYRDLSFLFSEEPGPAVLSVIDNLPVNESSLPTHLALGNLLRSKGEIEGATRIHQNLLSRPSLPRDLLQAVHLELARDYISAGLLDRAERLLKDLVEEGGSHRRDALSHLQHIYQTESEWEKSIAVAKQRLPKRSWLGRSKEDPASTKQVSRAISHYYCELAERSRSNGDMAKVSRHLTEAQRYDPDNIRAALMSAQRDCHDHPQRAVQQLQTLMCAHPEFICESLALYRQAFAASPKNNDYLAAIEKLSISVESTALQLEVIAERIACGQQQSALHYFREVLARRPTVNLISAAPQLQIDLASSDVSRAISDVEAGRPTYRCQHCGFSGRKLHWLCPGCEEWGTIAPIRGKLGD